MLPWILGTIKRFQKTVTIATVCLVTVFLSFGVPVIGWAQSADSGVPVSEDTFGLAPVAEGTVLSAAPDIRVIIARIVRAALGLLGTIAILLILYAGYIIMTSGGNEERIATGKRILINATIGLVIILSALGIVQFILNALIGDQGDGPNSGGGRGGLLQTFAASGALGPVIRDHYPERDQADVYRNTKIVVTFREPIDVESVILDANTNGVFGDCLVPANNTVLDWARDCDRIDTAAVRLYPTAEPGAPIEMAAIVSRADAADPAYTFMFQPLIPPGNLLGSSTTTVSYTMNLLDGIETESGRSVFETTRDRRYEWRFTTATNSDTTPPSVVSMYPDNGAAIPRNSIIQITFSEPMDPTVVQGRTDTFRHIMFGSSGIGAGTLPQGEWRLSNGYRTVEFIPGEACGANSCGEIMYCIQMTCATDDDLACANGYQVLVRTARTLPGNTAQDFTAIPFSGVMDVAGNALDTSAPNTRQAITGLLLPDGRHSEPNRPTVPDINILSESEELDDNFWWNFTVQNRIDRTAPYIVSTEPSADASQVDPDAPLRITFSHRMLSDSLRDIRVDEFPIENATDPLWYLVRSSADSTVAGSRTVARVLHREFGPNDTDMYYFPVVPSSVKNVQQNCLYPGRGPAEGGSGTQATCTVSRDARGQEVVTGCVPVMRDEASDTGCVQTTLPQDGGVSTQVQASIEQCLSVMRRPDVSPPRSP